MLALPVVTAGAGLFFSCSAYALCWIFSIATGLLFVEIGLWLPRSANIVSMAKEILGSFGKWIAWGLYLFLFYSLTIAYIAEGGRLVAKSLPFLPSYLGGGLFVVLFGFVVCLGTKVLGRINAVLMAGLVVSYAGFVFLGLRQIEPIVFSKGAWTKAIFGLPVIFTSFSYQGVVPTLFEYLDRDYKKARAAIIIGATIPFLSYIVWDVMIKGVVPVEGVNGLLAAKKEGLSAIEPLAFFLKDSIVTTMGQFFAFFALTTSFIGVCLSLFDFFFDALCLKKTLLNRGGVLFFIYAPPLLAVWMNPAIFISALGVAGGIGCACLLGLLPIWMVWMGRYRQGRGQTKMLPGGRITLWSLFIFVLLEVILEVMQEVFLS